MKYCRKKKMKVVRRGDSNQRDIPGISREEVQRALNRMAREKPESNEIPVKV